MEKNKAILNSRNLDELIDIEFGKKGTKSREEFDKETNDFCLEETLKNAIQEGLDSGIVSDFNPTQHLENLKDGK